jgi:hypothetical protein
MKSILRCMIALAAIALAGMGATSELSAGGGCGQICQSPYCVGGGPPKDCCVQEWHGGQPACSGFQNCQGCFTLGPTDKTTCDLELVEWVIASLGGFAHSGPLIDVVVEAEGQHQAMLAELGFGS